MARTGKDGFGKTWAILPWAVVTWHNTENGPDYWVRSMVTDALENALDGENPLLATPRAFTDFTPEFMQGMLAWTRAVHGVVVGVL